MPRRAAAASCLALAASCLSPASAAGAVEITPSAADCVVAGRYSRVGACVTAPAGLRRARVFFRTEGAKAWSFVEMQPPGE